MAGAKRTKVRKSADERATAAAIALGRDLAATRRRRRLTQAALGGRVGVEHARVSQLEAGKGAGAPLGLWFALGDALERPFRAGFERDRSDQPADAGHLAMQELVLKSGRAAGFQGSFELPTRPSDPAHSTDVRLLDRPGRRMALVECWNTFGDLGAATRSSDRKRAEADALAIALGDDSGPFEVGLCWVIRDTKRNRELLARYPEIFASRFPGSSKAWAKTLTTGAPMPREPGLIWCDLSTGRLFARRPVRA